MDGIGLWIRFVVGIGCIGIHGGYIGFISIEKV